VDAIRVRYTTDAAAMRCDHCGGVVWQCEGGLVEVVDALLTMPAPLRTLWLVHGRAPAGLWLRQLRIPRRSARQKVITTEGEPL
jgi:hypothetical protein